MISYPSERMREAQQVVSYLKALGLSIWFDKDSLVAGDDWSREIEAAITKSEVVVVISSKETVSKSGVLQRELNRILDLLRERPLGSNFLINIRVEDVALPPELARFQWLDFFSNDWKSSLLRAIYKKYQQLDRSPTPQVIDAMAQLSASTDTSPRTIQAKEANMEFIGSYFVYRAENDYWQYINAEITAAVYSSYYNARGDFLYYDNDKPMSWSLDVEEYCREGDLLSIKCFWFQDAGGAHPSHGVFTLNFAGTNHGKIRLDNLFAHSEEVIRHIRRYCNLDIKRQQLAIGEELDIDLDNFAGSENPWEIFEQFSFNRKGITFNLSPYSVLPYVYGSHEVFMPWDFFEDKLNDSFKGTEIEKIISKAIRA